MEKRVVIGPLSAPLLEFDNSSITGLTELCSVSAVGSELAIDTFTPVVEYQLFIRYQFVPADSEKYARIVTADGFVFCAYYNYDIRAIPYGTEIRFYTGTRLNGLFYVKSVERVAKSSFKINCTSAIGLMDKQEHRGGMYNGEKFEEVLSDIIGDKLSYSVDPDVAALQVYGWLPFATRRSNLHQLLLAYGVNILKADTGGMLFSFMHAARSELIPTERIYISGDVDYGNPASRVDVHEHGYYYLPSVEFSTLFDSKGETVDKSLVKFKEPIYPESLKTDEEGGLEIIERGVNFAVVSGSGVLMGQPYVHTTRIISAHNENADTENIKTVSEVTLVSMANSENCLKRISEYYFKTTVVNNSIVLDGEKPGRYYTFENPFGEQTSAFLASMSATASNIVKADCEFIQDYYPVAQGNAFQRRVMLEPGDAEQEWEIPASVFEKDVPQIRVVLIGAGYDGRPGGRGSDGEYGTDNSGGKGGSPGKGGKGGKGGKILTVTINCQGLKSIKFGRDGKNTWISAGSLYYSSSFGQSSETGFIDMFTGAVYALPGKDGVDGAPGGDAGAYPPIGASPTSATNGADLEFEGVTYKGGKKANKLSMRANQHGYHDNMTWRFGGCGGGGAAVGGNGKDAHDKPEGMRQPDEDWNAPGMSWPYGGDGADAAPSKATALLPGTGGDAGNGGGGGGGACNQYWWNDVYTTLISITTENIKPGKGGKGSEGLEGAPGCILLYH